MAAGTKRSLTRRCDLREALVPATATAAFDLLLGDVEMPGLQPHGINVGNTAIKRPRGPKVIYITGDPRSGAEWIYRRG